MPDAKYLNPASSEEYSFAQDYPEVMKSALLEMHRQVGDLDIKDGVATRGLLVRHLVMPDNVAGSLDIIDLPSLGIRGNSHFPMMDNNSEAIASLVQDWIESKDLMR